MRRLLLKLNLTLASSSSDSFFEQANKSKSRDKKRNAKLNGVMVPSPMKPQSKETNPKWVKKQAQKKKFAERDEKERLERLKTVNGASADRGDVVMEDSRKVEKKAKAREVKRHRKNAMKE